MNDYIVFFEKKYNLKLKEKDQEVGCKNIFSLHSDGTLKSLELNDIILKDLTDLLPIASNIEELKLAYCELEDLTGLSTFNQLKKLDLKGNEFTVNDFYELEGLIKLNALNLEATDFEDSACACLKNLQNLKQLYLGYNGGLEEVRELEGLTALKQIDLAFSGISSIKKIALNENIQSINLKNSLITEMIGLERFPELKELNLSSSQISKIEGLETNLRLQKLNISSSRLSQIDHLGHLINLEILDLGNQEIREIKGIESLKSLKKLNLSENKIQKVEHLDTLINLEYLGLDYNDIDYLDTQFLYNLVGNCLISICGNPISHIPKLGLENIEIRFNEGIYWPVSL